MPIGKTALASRAKKTDKDKLKVYVGGLPFKCGKSDVRAHFEACGEIDWLHMPLDAQERTRGIAFISFWTQESVDAALEFDGKAFNFQAKDYLLKVNMAGAKPAKVDKPLKAESADEAKTERVVDGRSESVWALLEDDIRAEEDEEKIQEQSKSKDRKVFIGGVPFSCTKETLKTDFAVCGAIQQVTLPMRSGENDRSRGIAFITFSSKEGAEKALEFNDTVYGEGKLTVRMACEKVEKGKLKGVPRSDLAEKVKGSKVDANPLEVIVKGLAFGTKEDALREWLVVCGVIDSLRMPVNKKGKSIGFAFVTFPDKKGVKHALKLSGSEFGGRPCTVQQTGDAPEKKEQEEGKAPKTEKVNGKKRGAEPDPGAEEAEVEKTPKVKKAKRAKTAAAGDE